MPINIQFQPLKTRSLAKKKMAKFLHKMVSNDENDEF